MVFLADTMKQPKKRKNKRSDFGADGSGIEYCDECPFLGLRPQPFCNTSDEELSYDKNNKIPVPDWCGNKKS